LFLCFLRFESESTILGSVLASVSVGGDPVADHYGVFRISQKQHVFVGTIANA
jgi:hypothetical protein